MKYQILDNRGNLVKEIESNNSKEEILRNYPINYNLKTTGGMMTTMQFLKDTLEEINPKLALGSSNPTINFLDLTIGEFEKLKHSVYQKYNVIIRLNHMFRCDGLVCLAEKIESLDKIKIETSKD